jgi:hypothetical protein
MSEHSAAHESDAGEQSKQKDPLQNATFAEKELGEASHAPRTRRQREPASVAYG